MPAWCSPRDVLARVVAGLPSRAIAMELRITAATVQDHLKSVFAKTGVRSRRELVATILHL
ncbi:helix-turn-helix transcriptional regulator [Streptomyces sp. NPDC056160]|uniref:helix-turn-helix domain-containing protein n=1 Tax=Streptomyces sp. NPDC056160 TaxID=3345731 RepID=UPI0035E1834B